MSTLSSKDLEGKKVFAQKGREVGVVEAIEVDLRTWQIETIRLKLKRQVLEELHFKVPILGSQSIRLPVEHIDGVGDTVVLSTTMEQLAVMGAD